jgi:hypothetical protein
MIKFLKENGYPMTLLVETTECEDKENEFKGYLTTIDDDQGKEIAKFTHTELRTRIQWVDGFFTCYRMLKKRKHEI